MEPGASEAEAGGIALAKAVGDSAGPLAAECILSDEAKALLGDGGMAPGAYLAGLMEADLLFDAIAFLAVCLPKREGAWWAAQAARMTDLGDEHSLARRTVRAAEAWVVQPSEDTRYAAADLAEELGTDSPAAWAALAAFWSGDSLTPRDAPKVPPGPFLAARAVSGGVIMSAAAVRDAAEIPTRQRSLLQKGIDIANGGTGRDPADGGAPR